MFSVTETKIEKWKLKNNAVKIIEAMKNKDKSVRIAAIKAASEMKSEDILNTLIILLREDPDPEIRMNAAKALGVIGNPRCQNHLAFAGQNDSDEGVREKAQEALKELIAKKQKRE